MSLFYLVNKRVTLHKFFIEFKLFCFKNEDKLKSKDFIMQVFRKEFTGQAGLKTIRIETRKFEEKL